MSSLLIPKEQQSAYERWEMLPFTQSGHAKTSAKREVLSPELSEKLAQITESARQEGYAKGEQQGYAEGMEQAQQDSTVQRAALAKLAETMQQAMHGNEQQIAQDLLRLALDIAKSMLKNKIEVNRDIVLPVIIDAMQSMPYVQKPAKMIVHPEDAAVIKRELAEELNGTWLLIENREMERGGCQIETGANQIDASNATRWKRINQALGQNVEWASHD